MRSVLICVLFTVGFVGVMAATATHTIPSGLTVILDFRGVHSEPSIREMERESGSILKSAGIETRPAVEGRGAGTRRFILIWW